MKNRFITYLAGVLTAVLLIALPVSALASDGSLTLTIHPVQVLLNGQVFQPKDVDGNSVYVFSSAGTTYVPLRALAEACGLEVSYDTENNIVTVNGMVQAGEALAESMTEEAQPSDFLSQWTVKPKPVSNYGSENIFTATYNGSMSMNEFREWWKSLDPALVERCSEQMAADALNMTAGGTVTMYFSYGTYMLGTAYAFGDFEQSNFNFASTWI